MQKIQSILVNQISRHHSLIPNNVICDEIYIKRVDDYTVLRSCLLPTSVKEKNSDELELSASAARGEQKNICLAMEWLEASTDNMRLMRNVFKLPKLNNQPELFNKKISYNNFIKNIIEGFEICYQWVINNLSKLKETNSKICVVSIYSNRLKFPG